MTTNQKIMYKVPVSNITTSTILLSMLQKIDKLSSYIL